MEMNKKYQFIGHIPPFPFIHAMFSLGPMWMCVRCAVFIMGIVNTRINAGLFLISRERSAKRRSAKCCLTVCGGRRDWERPFTVPLPCQTNEKTDRHWTDEVTPFSLHECNNCIPHTTAQRCIWEMRMTSNRSARSPHNNIKSKCCRRWL